MDAYTGPTLNRKTSSANLRELASSRSVFHVLVLPPAFDTLGGSISDCSSLHSDSTSSAHGQPDNGPEPFMLPSVIQALGGTISDCSSYHSSAPSSAQGQPDNGPEKTGSPNLRELASLHSGAFRLPSVIQALGGTISDCSSYHSSAASTETDRTDDDEENGRMGEKSARFGSGGLPESEEDQGNEDIRSRRNPMTDMQSPHPSLGGSIPSNVSLMDLDMLSEAEDSSMRSRPPTDNGQSPVDEDRITIKADSDE